MIRHRTLAAGLLGALALACDHGAAPPAQAPAEEPARASASESGAFELAPEEFAALELEFAVPERAQWIPELRAFGRVASQPSAAVALRAPFAGTLLASDGRGDGKSDGSSAADAGATPALGAHLAAGQVVFRLAPRYTPVERRDLAAQRATSAGELAALEAELPTLRAETERARKLNAADKTVSDRERADAEARLATAEARAAGARELVRALTAAEEGRETELALILPAGGEVTELDARAGETVEAGAVLLRVEDFGAPLVAIDLPPGSVSADAVRAARVERVDAPGEFLEAERVGSAPTSAGAAPALLFRVHAEANACQALRPGLALTAWLRLDRPALAGVRVPSSAVVRLAGEAFVYARRGEHELERVPLALARPLAGGWFADEGWLHGEPPALVVRGAQQVLSRELLGHQGEEEE